MSESMIQGRKQAPCHLGNILILGLGKTGRAALSYCLPLLGNRVSALSVYAGEEASIEALSEEWPNHRISFVDKNDIANQKFDLGIVSPGISVLSDLYTNASSGCTELIGEVEFAWRESAEESRWIAVTGTNGKTTTTSLISSVLQSCGLNARAVGNIGDTCLDAVMRANVDVYVAEVSSYQLESTSQFSPDVGILLNITPDHLAWHGNFEAYVTAKKKMFAHMKAGSVAILDATDDCTRSIVREIKKQDSRTRAYSYIPLGTSQGIEFSMIDACKSTNAAYVNTPNFIVEFEGAIHSISAVDALKIKGSHNTANALAAATCAIVMGGTEQAIAQGLASFEPLEHRIEPCGSLNGVKYYNDSKATNPDATIKALSAFEHDRLILLLGGSDKGTDLHELAAATRNCKAIICFGQAGQRFFEALGTSNSFRAKTLSDAVKNAQTKAVSGDTVLLSPACASFDEFDSFEHRGTTFKKLVACNKEGE